MDTQLSPSRSIATHLRGALNAARGAWRHAARLALDIALPTLCVACPNPSTAQARHSLCLRSRP
jgi:hypothetical protein